MPIMTDSRPTLEDRASPAILLRELPERALRILMAQKSKSHDHVWLQAVVDQKLLDVTGDMQALDAMKAQSDHARALVQYDALSQLLYRVTEMTGFTENIAFFWRNPDGYPTYTNLAFYGQEQGGSDEFKALFEQVLDQIAVSCQAFGKGVSPVERELQSYMITDIVAHAMVAACVLDLPEHLDKLIKVCPAALQATVPLQKLSSKMMETFLKTVVPENENDSNDDPDQEAKTPAKDAPEAHVTPFFVALQLSRTDCMNVMVAGGMDKSLSLGRYTCEDQYDSIRPHTLHAAMGPCCEPETLTKALAFMREHALNHRSFGSDEVTRESLFDAGMAALKSDDRWLASYSVAYANAGVMDFDPYHAIKEACEQGHPVVVQHFLSTIPWQALAPTFESSYSPIGVALTASKVDDEWREHEEAVKLLLNQAIEDGQSDVVFQTHAVKDPGKGVRIEPVFTLAEKGWSDAVVHFLDHGFDPNEKAPGGTLSLLDVVREENPAMTSIIHAHQARKKAREVLLEISSPVTINKRSLP